jgi:hypothetical protein
VSSTGTATLKITSVAASGAGFGLSPAPTLPLNLSPGESTTLYVAFTPTIAGSATGGLSIASNATNAPRAGVSLSGGGIARIWAVDLTWDAPGGSDPIVGYNVYRKVSGTRVWAQLNAWPVPTRSYTDQNVSTGSWDYHVCSVDARGALSGPSNVFTVAVP